MSEEIFIPYSKTILQLFEGSVFYQIPSYQRPYSWDTEQIEQLWDDIYEAYQNGDSEYFLGSIILTKTKDNKNLEVIDGQQRITTLMILFCTLRDLYYQDILDSKKKNRILGRIKDLETDTQRLKLKTQLHHQNEFEQKILNKINFDEKVILKGHKTDKFLNAAFVFKKKIEDIRPKPNILEGFTEYLLENVRIVSIECTTLSFAIKLFQVLNNRGMDLTPADLIKSHLMGRLVEEGTEDDLEVFEREWNDIENKAKEFEEDLTNLFIYYEYYLLASNPRKSLYEELINLFKNKCPKEIIYQFKCLLSYLDEIDSENSKVIYSLYYLRHNIYWKSILLSAKLERWSNEDFIGLARLLRNFYYLYWIGDYTSSKTKQTSYNIIGWIKEKKDLNFIRDKLKQKLSEDRVLNKVLRNLENNVYETAWFKPLLVLVEYHQTDETLKYIDLDKFIHVEHILPQGYAKIDYWTKLYSLEKADKLVNSIGNLTLLSGKKNIEASNNPFYEKLKVYRGKGIDGMTGYVITQRIVNDNSKDTDWTSDKIEERKNWVFEEIGKIFEIDLYQYDSEEEDETEDESTANEKKEEIKTIYENLIEKIENLGQDVRKEQKKFYLAFKKKGNFVSIQLQNYQIKMWIRCSENKFHDPKGLSKNVAEIGHHGTGNYQVIIKEGQEVEDVLSLIKLAYENDASTTDNYDLDYHFSKIEDKKVLERLKELKDKINAIGTNIEEHYSKFHIKFRHNVDFCNLFCQKNQFWVDIKLPKNEITDSNLDIRDHKDTIWTHIRISDETSLSKLMPFIKKAYEEN